ncbi:hypothetical protein [Stenotrophomonas phage A1432]|uniref:Uncharacterized protein n=1 Tax=Stenotrophomonas phage A1432 TaxID=2930315 RepID=A0A9E7N2S8_9CAUD|nr:hypothetical protein P9A45_gp37 [Stenotrophomonas phage A1432]UTC27993.1 hypothetical protein [Stenotrophomonas phage A1432]
MPGLHMRRVENLVSSGDPDVDGCINGVYFELELKGCNRPKHGGVLDFEVRQAQVVWHRKRWRVGGNCWIYCRVGRDRDIQRYLVPGDKAQILADGVTEAQLAELSLISPDLDAKSVLAFVRQAGILRAPAP